jgi:hypothetical protein
VVNTENYSLPVYQMVKEIFAKNRPELSPGSLRTYTSILTNLAKQMEIEIKTPSDVIKHYKEIISHLKDVAPKVRKTRLACLIVFIEKDAEKEKDTAVDAFRKLMISDIDTYKKEVDEQQLTERQKEGMMTMDEIMKKYTELEKEVSPLFKKDTLDKKQFAHAQLYVLLSCLLLIPPRRSTDYTEFKMRNTDSAKDNYMKTEKKVSSFVFNTYKTAKKYGQQCEVIPKKLVNIIKAWGKLNPHDYMLMNSKQTGKISPTQLTHMLHHFFGKPLSTSLLRHIYLSDKYKNMPALKDMKATANAMGHSVAMAMEYVKH